MLKTFTANAVGKLSAAVMNNIENIGYASVMKIIRAKDVKVNRKRVKADCTLAVGDEVAVYYAIREDNRIPCETVFRSKDVIAVDKKAGFTSEQVFSYLLAVEQANGADICATEQANGEGKGSLKIVDGTDKCAVKQANGAKEVVPKTTDGAEKSAEVFFIHRLDRNTSGIIIFALSAIAERELISGFKKHSFDKNYIAEVFGCPEIKERTIVSYLVKDKENSYVKVFDSKIPGGVEIKTSYRTLETHVENGVTVSRLEVKILTGKTHQIRAHLAHIGHFVIGDGKYGKETINRKLKTKKQRLVARSLTLHFDKNSPLFYLDGKTLVSKTDL